MNYKTIKLNRYLNLDGSITIADMDENLPFEVKRLFSFRMGLRLVAVGVMHVKV